jgi:hypothetical protein
LGEAPNDLSPGGARGWFDEPTGARRSTAQARGRVGPSYGRLRRSSLVPWGTTSGPPAPDSFAGRSARTHSAPFAETRVGSNRQAFSRLDGPMLRRLGYNSGGGGIDGASRRRLAGNRLRPAFAGIPTWPLGSNPLCASLRNARGFERTGTIRLDSSNSRLSAVPSGGGGIRTHVGLRPPVFKTGALNRSATPPRA